MSHQISRKHIIKLVGRNVTVEAAEDIANDVILDMLENGMPSDLKELVARCKHEHVKLYIKQKDIDGVPLDLDTLHHCIRDDGIDFDTPFDVLERFYVEVD
jgi:hypothetical protein